MHADRRWEVVYVGILDVNEPVSSLKSSLYVQQAVATEKKGIFFKDKDKLFTKLTWHKRDPFPTRLF